MFVPIQDRDQQHLWNDMMSRFHYLKRPRLFGPQLRYLIYGNKSNGGSEASGVHNTWADRKKACCRLEGGLRHSTGIVGDIRTAGTIPWHVLQGRQLDQGRRNGRIQLLQQSEKKEIAQDHLSFPPLQKLPERIMQGIPMPGLAVNSSMMIHGMARRPLMENV